MIKCSHLVCKLNSPFAWRFNDHLNDYALGGTGGKFISGNLLSCASRADQSFLQYRGNLRCMVSIKTKKKNKRGGSKL